jgi:hypothetical protein
MATVSKDLCASSFGIFYYRTWRNIPEDLTPSTTRLLEFQIPPQFHSCPVASCLSVRSPDIADWSRAHACISTGCVCVRGGNGKGKSVLLNSAEYVKQIWAVLIGLLNKPSPSTGLCLKGLYCVDVLSVAQTQSQTQQLGTHKPALRIMNNVGSEK